MGAGGARDGVSICASIEGSGRTPFGGGRLLTAAANRCRVAGGADNATASGPAPDSQAAFLRLQAESGVRRIQHPSGEEARGLAAVISSRRQRRPLAADAEAPMIDRDMIELLNADQARTLAESYAKTARELFARYGRATARPEDDAEKHFPTFRKVEQRGRLMRDTVRQALAAGKPLAEAFARAAAALNTDPKSIEYWWHEMNSRDRRLERKRRAVAILRARCLRREPCETVARRHHMCAANVNRIVREELRRAGGDAGAAIATLGREISRLRNPYARQKRRAAERRRRASALASAQAFDNDAPIRAIIDDWFDTFKAGMDFDEVCCKRLNTSHDWRSSPEPRAVAARAREEEMFREERELELLISETPALTMLGVALKLRWLVCSDIEWGDFGDNDRRLLRSALDDASRLCGGRDSFKWARSINLGPGRRMDLEPLRGDCLDAPP